MKSSDRVPSALSLTSSLAALSVAALSMALSLNSAAQDTHNAPKDQQIPGPACFTIRGVWEGGYVPCTAASHDEWLKDITHWRTERRIRTGYDPARYELAALKWAQSSYIQPQMMVHDLYFYDASTHKYTVDRYLDDLKTRYGGIDSVLVWATYPNMGIDDRNQLDMVRSMPGGIEGLQTMVKDFHRRGVRVLFPMMMWDEGTHEPGSDWPSAIADLMKSIDADGINGDTQDGVPLAFSLAAEKAGHPLAFEPEGGPHDEGLSWNVMTWGQYTFGFVPSVDRYRWLEPRHQVNIQGRWVRDKTDDLQFAFFNGEGWESWENVWGIWNGVTPRDGEATRRMATLERGIAPFLVSQGWEPFYPMHLYGVFASRWPVGDRTVWTIVNRNEYEVKTRQLSVPHEDGMRYFDLYHGLEIKPDVENGDDVISFPIEGHGYGAILAQAGEPDAHTLALLNDMKTMTAKPLSDYSHEWKSLPQKLVEIQPTKAATSTPEGMVSVPGGDYLFRVQGIELEGSDDVGVDVQYPWEATARRFHEHRMNITPFYMDKYPVTNAEFKKFVVATHYRPTDDMNFLKDWKDGNFPEDGGNRPVTWVSLEDARAYAKWAGKRLPHEWEWQFAAQGNDRRSFPWGDCDWLAPEAAGGSSVCASQKNPSRAPAPFPDKGRAMSAANDVNSHPQGASPFGVEDMVGNVWQWTDEYQDEHTRGAILRGGNHYQPQGSVWYFPQAYRNEQHGKLLLMAPSYDRSGGVGFRCVKDAR